jgi:multidrug efflux pump subunit AcrA (membrane-fusion protein)
MRKKLFWLCGVVALLTAGGASAALWWHGDEPTAPGPAAAPETPPLVVKTIRPRRDPSFGISVQQLATVEPFFRADLRARVAGPVTFIRKDVGDRVWRGELLVQIDAPDREEEVAQKQAVIQQRLQEVTLAETRIRVAQATVQVARDNVEQQQAEVGRAKASMDYRYKEWVRFRQLASQNAAQQGIVDEAELYYRSAEAGHASAKVAVRKAQAELQEDLANLEAAEADLALKQTLVDVAVRDHNRAVALADFARIEAPFDGVVVERRVDRGSFIPNATTSQTDPFLSVARTDIVTVVMKVPDNYASLVSRDADAVLQLDELPGVVLRGKVTRFTPAIRPTDRTLRVEVDLYTGSEQDYRKFVARGVAGYLAPLGTGCSLATAALTVASHEAWAENRKGFDDPFPLHPRASGETAPAYDRLPLLPGMSGRMRLVLRQFDHAYLVPSGTVFTRGGRTYLLMVRDGKAEQVPVRVQVDDGRLARVVVVVRPADPAVGVDEVWHELTGQEEIITGQQGEISPGRPVKTVVTEW